MTMILDSMKEQASAPRENKLRSLAIHATKWDLVEAKSTGKRSEETESDMIFSVPGKLGHPVGDGRERAHHKERPVHPVALEMA